MSSASEPAAISVPHVLPPPRSERGEFTWELATLFPRQGDWTEEEYLARDFNGLVEYVAGMLEFLHRVPEDEGGPPQSDRGDWTWELLAEYPRQGEWTESEYLQLETNQLVEFNNGVLEFLPVVTPLHQDLVLYLRDKLKRATRGQYPGRVYVAPLRVCLKNGKYREPDVIFAKPEHIADRRKPLGGAELVMEIVSGSAADRHRDFVAKRADYALAGIREYWIVDPDLETVTVLTLNQDGQYDAIGRFHRGEFANSVIFPQFTIDVTECFAVADGTVD
jgi:Uma2 family endonuclease